ncbi:MAG TPA: MASE1 domain-containing protein [Candidatus Limnocylindrales bacterium]|nr:MASE1 domain-containing protein [Candidatus Limnocylindrales bacterium]
MVFKIIKLSLIFLAYFISGKIGLQLASVNASSTAVWAPTGIAIAIFILKGYRIWPVIFLAAFFTNLTTAGTVFTSFGISVGNTLEGLLASYFIITFADGRAVFNSARGILKFIIIVIFACMISATWGLSSLLLGGLATAGESSSIWTTWWLGDISGAIIITPLILFWKKKYLFHWSKNRLLEAVSLLFGIVVVSGAVFNSLFFSIPSYLPLEFLCIPLLVWASLRFDRRETMTAIVIMASISIWGTIRGHGPFSQFSPSESLILLQTFLDVVTIMILSLASVVAERKRLSRLFKSTLDNMREGFQIIGFDYKYIYVNDAVAKQGKHTQMELLGHTMMEIYPGIEKTEMFTYLKKCLFERIPHSMENEFMFSDGSNRWFGLKIEPITEGALILSIDITAQKDSQKTLAKGKAEAEALLNSIGDGIIATDSEGKIILANIAFEELMGFSEEELIGVHSFDKLLIEDEKRNVLLEKDRPLTIALKTGKKVTATHYLVRKNGTKFPALITAAPVVIEKKIIGAIKVFHDITREKEIDEMKTEFISMASHELRTPLSAIKGFVSMINNGDYGKVDRKQQRPLQLVAMSTDRLINIVNEMLDVSRIEAGKVILHLSDYEISKLVQETVAILKPLAVNKNLKLDILESEILHVHADKEKIVQILNNLIGNSIKLTDKGGITISIKQNKNKIVIFVKDTGIGIALADQNKLFNKFEQLKSKKEGKVAGTGLGLYISREYAREMDGDLWIEKSALGKGSTFALSVPVGNPKSTKSVVSKNVTMSV